MKFELVSPSAAFFSAVTGVLTCLAILIVTLPNVNSHHKLSGPYTMDLKRIEHCDERGTKDMDFSVKQHKYSKYTYSYNFNWTLNFEFDDDGSMTADIHVSRWGNGGWLMNAYRHLSRKPCGDLLNLGDPYSCQFLNGSGLECKCPIPMGNYSAHEVVFEGKKIANFTELLYGEYKMDVTYKKNEIVVGCWRAFFDINPAVE